MYSNFLIAIFVLFLTACQSSIELDNYPVDNRIQVVRGQSRYETMKIESENSKQQIRDEVIKRRVE